MYRDDEPPDDPIMVDFERVEVRRAKVPHRCSTCSQLIQPGQVYTRIWALIEGENQVQKFHGHMQGECLSPEDLGMTFDIEAAERAAGWDPNP